MSGLKDILGATVAGSVVTGFFGYFVGDFTANFPWPVSHPAFGFVVGAILGFAFSVLALSMEGNRQSGIELFAQTHANQFRKSISKPEATQGAEKALIFSNWDEASNVVEGEFQGIPFRMFDLTRKFHNRSTSDGPRTTYQTQSVVVIDSLPEKEGSISFQRKPWFRKFFEAVVPAIKGDKIMTLKTADRFAQATIDAFAEKYTVHGQGDLVTTNVGVLKSLTESRGWSIERIGSTAIFYMQRKLLRMADLPTAMNEIKQFLDQIETSSEAEGVKIIPRDDVAEFSVAGLAKLLAGAAVGMLGSLAVFIPFFFRFAKDYPFIVFLFPVFGLICCVGGVFIATRIGR